MGLISLGFFGVYLTFAKSKKDHYVEKGIPFLIVANLLNGRWLYLWLTENILLSVICMGLIFLSLYKVVTRLRMELWDAPMKVIVLVLASIFTLGGLW